MGWWLLPWASWPKPPARNVTSHPKRWETRTAPDPPRDQGFILPDAAKTASTPPHLDIAGRALCTKLKNAAHHFWWLLDPHRVWARCPQNVACAARPTGGMCAPPAAGLLRRPDAYRSYPRPCPARLRSSAYASQHACDFNSGRAPSPPFRELSPPRSVWVKTPPFSGTVPGRRAPEPLFPSRQRAITRNPYLRWFMSARLHICGMPGCISWEDSVSCRSDPRRGLCRVPRER